uniref:C2 tensin-type domain-containing protein n=1 Tax=Pyrodinium bahamense TaxID=73915 RepID=A0A7R9ZUT5_9DINO
MDAMGRAKVQGVETRSQVRYIEYMSRLLHEQRTFFPRQVQPPHPVELRLRELRLCGMFQMPPPEELVVLVRGGARRRQVMHVSGVAASAFDLEGVVVQGDVLIEVYGRGNLSPSIDLALAVRRELEQPRRRSVVNKGEKRSTCLLYFFVHTSFLEGEQLQLLASTVDKGSKKKGLYNDSGSVELTFSAAT